MEKSEKVWAAMSLGGDGFWWGVGLVRRMRDGVEVIDVRVRLSSPARKGEDGEGSYRR